MVHIRWTVHEVCSLLKWESFLLATWFLRHHLHDRWPPSCLNICAVKLNPILIRRKLIHLLSNSFVLKLLTILSPVVSTSYRCGLNWLFQLPLQMFELGTNVSLVLHDTSMIYILIQKRSRRILSDPVFAQNIGFLSSSRHLWSRLH